MKILHTADVHIGAKFVGLGKRAAERRQALKRTFARGVDIALEREVDAYVVAGDLFDSNEVSVGDVVFAAEQLKRLTGAGVRVVVSAGTHDNLSDGSPVLLSRAFRDGAPDVVVLAEEVSQVVFDDIGLGVSAVSNHTKKSRENPFGELKPAEGAEVNVAMIHGSLQIPGKSADNDYPFSVEDVDGSGFDYVALGHWHNFQEIPTKVVKAAYSGSSEPFDFRQTRSGHVAVVEFVGGEVSVEPVKVSETEFVRLEMDVSAGDEDMSAVMTRVRRDIGEAVGSAVYLQVVLGGVVAPGQVVSVDELREEFGPRCAWFGIESNMVVGFDGEALGEFGDDTVVGRYVRVLRDEIEAAESEEARRVAEQALQTGVAMMMGGGDE